VAVEETIFLPINQIMAVEETSFVTYQSNRGRERNKLCVTHQPNHGGGKIKNCHGIALLEASTDCIDLWLGLVLQ
jgi:hypothetical protein